MMRFRGERTEDTHRLSMMTHWDITHPLSER